MKQDLTMAYLRYKAGERPTLPNPAAYRRVLPDGSVAPVTEDQARVIRERVDGLVAKLRRQGIAAA